jgi:hypothetical protein
MLQKLRSHLSFANVVSLVALSVALGGTTYAATGGNFILGQSNSATSTTALSAGPTGPAFKATNTSTGTAGSFNVAAGHPPLTVNSGTKVTNLNADKLDGLDSTSFVSSSKLQRVGPVTVTVASGTITAPIATLGHFSFAGVCTRGGSGGNDEVGTTIASDVAHSAFASLTQAGAGTAAGEADMLSSGLVYSIADTTLPTGAGAFSSMSGDAVAPDGQEVVFNLYEGLNARHQPGQCVFGGSFVVK